ncbi:MAG: ABC transporter permease, partial [Gibbsiella quercinecans]|uniref:ABC transporter permease n=1 Tax=Gibbsiella quercinecans TaxID=929813 RepID=UPI003F2C7D77
MLWRMLWQSWRRNLRRKALAVLTVFLAAGLISALLAVSIDVGDKMSRELKSYGANILIEPASQAILPAISGESGNPLDGQDFLDEAELPAIKDIFWRNNIVGFAPLLSGEVTTGNDRISVLGTFFFQPVNVPDEEDYRTGQQAISPYWQVSGQWPTEPPTPGKLQALAGAALARHYGWKPGDTLQLHGPSGERTVTLSGILASGGDEDNQLVMPLAIVQDLLGLQGKVQAIRVSALTVPENALSRRARENLDALN